MGQPNGGTRDTWRRNLRNGTDEIRLYDDPGTLFYFDPPYVHPSRGDTKAYRFEMDDSAHMTLAEVLRGCKAKVAVSGYRCKLMDELYRGWRRVDAPLKICHSIKKHRQEALWLNF